VFKDKHSSLVRKMQITAVISFMIQVPGWIALPQTNALAHLAIFWSIYNEFFSLLLMKKPSKQERLSITNLSSLAYF
jgi:hypothetical protein